MSNSDLRTLEKEIESTRKRLATNLSLLNSPSTFSEFKETVKREAEASKGRLIERAKSSVQSTFQEVVEDLKAKAAANPAATIAIGSGLAWKLFKNPPVASALIGIGVVSLLRTKSPRTPDHFETAKSRLKEQVSDAASVVGDRVSDMTSDVVERVSAVADRTKQQATALADKTRQKVHDWQDGTTHFVEPIKSAGRELAMDLERQFERVGDSKDALLLGAAGLAVAAALGIAYQRSRSE